MAKGVRFTKEERELLHTLLEADIARTFRDAGRRHKIAKSMLEKLDASEMVKPIAQPGIGWKAAADAMRVVLGTSLALPPRPDTGWMARMSNRIRELGLSVENCTAIAQHLKSKRWASYSFDRTIWIADRLLAEAQDIPTSTIPTAHVHRGPVEVTDI